MVSYMQVKKTEGSFCTMCNKDFVTYEQFGAVGDGVTEDFPAIYKAHEYANEIGASVKARDGAHYYIHDNRIDGEARSAIIKTDVDWGSASFTIDDRDISTNRNDETHSMNIPIFKVESDYEKVRITDREIIDKVVEAGLLQTSKKVALKFDYPAMIIPYNEKHKVYRRRSYGTFRGQLMREIIVIDTEGNIDESTPLMFDYDNIDYIDVVRLDVKPITISGGEFTTRASRVNCVFRNEKGVLDSNVGYITRSIRVERSYTTVKNVKHYVTDEAVMDEQIKDGEVVFAANAYHGFFEAYFSNEITFDGCVLTARRCYRSPKRGTMGTYDLTGSETNKLIFKNCRQSNFWITIDENGIIHPAKEGDEGAMSSMAVSYKDDIKFQIHWGIGGSNFCKNMEYHNSTLSRFDAHCGLYNGKIINSNVNAIALIGKGNFTVENTTVYVGRTNSNMLFALRGDYGATWNGNLNVKNAKLYAFTSRPIYVCHNSYANWYYGYDVAFPNISIDNIEFYDTETKEPLAADYEIFLCGDGTANEPCAHCEKTLFTPPYYADVDDDGDGFVDGTDIPYDNVVSRSGVPDENSRKNLNVITPPSLVKITSHSGAEGKCKIAVYDTSYIEGVSDGGFFGKTSFVTDGNTYVGTSYTDTETETFKFIKYIKSEEN